MRLVAVVVGLSLLGVTVGAGCTTTPRKEHVAPPATSPIVAPPRLVPPLTLPAQWVGGTRLRPMVFDAGDGVKLFRGWFDEAIGGPCSMNFTSDLHARCIPLGAFELTAPGASRLYLDSACAQPAQSTLSGTCAANTSITVDMDPSSCPAVFRVYSHGAPTQPAAFWEKSSSGPCVATTGIPGDVWPLQEMPPASFVAAHEEDTPVGNGIALRRVVADDGAAVSSSIIDTMHGRPCSAFYKAWAFDGPYKDRCLPLDGYEPELIFSDSQCKVPAKVHPRVGLPWLVARPEAIPDFCSADEFVGVLGSGQNTLQEVRRIGPKLDPSGYYTKMSGSCQPVVSNLLPIPQIVEIDALGDIVPPEEFPVLKVVAVGRGRMRTLAFAGEDGQPILEIGLHDASTGPCAPARFSSGPFCTPILPGPAPTETGFYFDSTCTSPVSSAEGGELQPYLSLKLQASGQCGASTLIGELPDSNSVNYIIANSFYPMDTSGGVWTKSAGGCTPAQYTGSFPTYVSTGPLDPASVLAPVVERVD